MADAPLACHNTNVTRSILLDYASYCATQLPTACLHASGTPAIYGALVSELAARLSIQIRRNEGCVHSKLSHRAAKIPKIFFIIGVGCTV